MITITGAAAYAADTASVTIATAIITMLGVYSIDFGP